MSNLAATSWLINTLIIFDIENTILKKIQLLASFLMNWWMDCQTLAHQVISGRRTTYPMQPNLVTAIIYQYLFLNEEPIDVLATAAYRSHPQASSSPFLRFCTCVLVRFLWLVSSFSSTGVFGMCEVCERGGSFVRETSHRGGEIMVTSHRNRLTTRTDQKNCVTMTPIMHHIN